MNEPLQSRMPFFAAIKKAEGPIPELRPPKSHIAVDLSDAAILNGAILLAFVVLAWGRIVQLRKPLPPPPVVTPVARARAALQAVAGPQSVTESAQIVRRFLLEQYGVGPEGATTRELCAAYGQHPAAQTEALAMLSAYLTESDLAQFAPAGAPFEGGCVSRALEVIERLEPARPPAMPPPLPVVT